jgi:hypothetical protein
MYCLTTHAKVCACIPGGHRPRCTRARAQPKQTPHTARKTALLPEQVNTGRKRCLTTSLATSACKAFCCLENPGNLRHATPKGHHPKASVSNRHIPTHAIRQEMAGYTQALTAGRCHSPLPCWEPQNLPRGMMHSNDPCDDRASCLQSSPAGLLLARTSPKPMCKPAYL